MAVELLLADSANLRQQLARATTRLAAQERQLTRLRDQLTAVRGLAGQLDALLLGFAAKLHFKELALAAQGSQIRMDAAAFRDLVAEVGLLKEKMQRLHDVLEERADLAPQTTAPVSSESGATAAVLVTNGEGLHSPIGQLATGGNSLVPPPNSPDRSPQLASQLSSPPHLSASGPHQPQQHQQRQHHQALRKQISWDPSTTTSTAGPAFVSEVPSTSAFSEAVVEPSRSSSRAEYDDDGIEAADIVDRTGRRRRRQDEDGDDNNDEENDDAASTESSQSLQDGILASASAGMIGLKTLQLFSRRSDALQGPQSRRWFNRLRCCTFQECAIVIHLIYLHLIALVAIGGVTCLIVGTTLEKKEFLVAGTVLVIASYGLFLNHCFYRSAAVSGSQPSGAQKVRIRDNASLDLEASTSETINIDLTRPPTRSILQVDLDSSHLSRAY